MGVCKQWTGLNWNGLTFHNMHVRVYIYVVAHQQLGLELGVYPNSLLVVVADESHKLLSAVAYSLVPHGYCHMVMLLYLSLALTLAGVWLLCSCCWLLG